MSTLKTVNIQHPSSSTPSITMDSTGAMTGSFPYPNRNLIYNGAMQVAQRGTSTASITTAGYYTTDRWVLDIFNNGTWTQDIQNDAPTGSGLRRSARVLCTTANASPAANSVGAFQQRLEGQDLQRIAKGTASAKKLTFSFWVKSNVTGTYVAELYDADNTRQVSATYTISQSATWEKKVISFPADTTGAFDNDNALSLYVIWWLTAGSNFSGGSSLNTTWSAVTDNRRAVGQTNVAAAINNYWQVTGVQLETGDVATDFEFKSYGQELRECQRYYCKTFPLATAPANNLSQTGCLLVSDAASTGVSAYAVSWNFPVPMRAAPTITLFTPSIAGSGGWYDEAGFEVAAASTNTSADRTSIYNTGAAVIGRNAAIHARAEIEL